MPRPLRPIADGPIYHVINRGNNRRTEAVLTPRMDNLAMLRSSQSHVARAERLLKLRIYRTDFVIAGGMLLLVCTRFLCREIGQLHLAARSIYLGSGWRARNMPPASAPRFP